MTRPSHAILDVNTRLGKARKAARILGGFTSLAGKRVLDIGTGSGVMAFALAQAVGPTGCVCSVDVRDERLETRAYQFLRIESTRLPFHDRAFDIVISNHVIEHVGQRPEQRRHLLEIKRVLKLEGILYLATPSRWALLEPHYRLPLLSWPPEPWRSRYIRLMRKGATYDCYPPSRAALKRLLSRIGMDAVEQSSVALAIMPEVECAPRGVRLAARLPVTVLRLLQPLMPTMIFIARRPRDPASS